jgi:hypothetical protein
VIARLLVAALVLASCGGYAIAPTPTLSPPTAAPSTAAPTTPTPPSATPLTSARGFITVARPLANSRVRSPLAISGDASVFEAALTWRVTDSAGRVLASGHTTASAGAPARGAYSITATFTPPASDIIGIVEVYELSPRDGQIDEIVRVPVVITP